MLWKVPRNPPPQKKKPQSFNIFGPVFRCYLNNSPRNLSKNWTYSPFGYHLKAITFNTWTTSYQIQDYSSTPIPTIFLIVFFENWPRWCALQLCYQLNVNVKWSSLVTKSSILLQISCCFRPLCLIKLLWRNIKITISHFNFWWLSYFMFFSFFY